MSKIKFPYWQPFQPMLTLQESMAKELPRVVEVGPGERPFAPATEFVGWSAAEGPAGRPFHVLDLNTDTLPFEDKSIDFIYCRHTLEDLYNPFHACQEMGRVAKSGYIETPSPIAEICRGVDGGGPRSRGYRHHRYLVWDNNGTLTFLAKYPVIEYVEFGPYEESMVQVLNGGPLYWNSYYSWSGEIKFQLMQHDKEFDLLTDYGRILGDAMNQSLLANKRIAAMLYMTQSQAGIQ